MILVVTSSFHFFNLILNFYRSVGDSSKPCSPLSTTSESVKLTPVSQRPKVRLKTSSGRKSDCGAVEGKSKTDKEGESAQSYLKSTESTSN